MNIVNINPSVSVVSALNEPIESCFQTLVLETTLESSLDSKEIKPFNPKGNQPWIFIERTGAVDEAPILWPPDAKIRLTGKDPDAGKRLKAGGEGGYRGWDGWMPSPVHQTWVWASSGREWKTGKPGMLQSRGLQTATTEQRNNNIYIKISTKSNYILFQNHFH